MLDGLRLKEKFSSSRVLATDVRGFVDEHLTDGDHRCHFLQILTPLPNKHITISEENPTLHELGSTEGGRIFARISGLFHQIATTTLAFGHHPPIPASVVAEFGKGRTFLKDEHLGLRQVM
ncbi:hypothetical protein HOY82DRAFT_595648 [Tuber indicum]|nr:hypothetical protein HOY82DRAFT_595648 [Tuber indicum]